MRTLIPGSSAGLRGKLPSLAIALVFAVLAMSAGAAPPIEMTAGGLQYRQLLEGEGDPATDGQVVRIHLIGWVDEQGQKGRELFNSRRDRDTIAFVLGTDKMMPAFNEGVRGMKPGGRRLLLVPPAFAYGERAIGEAIPAGTNLILLVDLVAVETD